MSPKQLPPEHRLIAVGNENIQVVGSNNIVQRITNIFQGDTDAQRARRNRHAMLELVKNTWIKGVLEKSLYNEVLIELGMEERPDVVNHPWDVQVQMPSKENRTLPASTSMMEVFDEMNGAMLILGEPGSGKTTMLLELARDCLERAQQDDNQPIPVYFNLSSWNGKQTIEEWLVNELWVMYEILKKTAQNWVTNNDLQLLLDGLDEVRPEIRDECVKAINEFRQEHGLTMPIVVCSRMADYEALKTKLSLRGAVYLRPLSPAQIDVYFYQAGSELKGIHQLLKNDEILQELVKQPLTLSIMTLAYQSKSAKMFTSDNKDTIDSRRKHLFDTYIQQMFGRVARTKNEIYTPSLTRKWLGWLATSMSRDNQSVFHIETMQPSWLPLGFQQSLVTTGPAILIGTIVGLVVWSTIQLGTNLDIGPLTGFVVGSILGPFVYSKEIKLVETLSWSWHRIFALLINSSCGSVMLVPIGGLVGALFGGLFNGLPGVFPGLFYGAVVTLLFGLVFSLSVTIILGPFMGLVKKEVVTRTTPNEGIHRSFRSAFISGTILGLYLGIIFGLIGGLVGGLVGIIIGGCCALWYGGVSCIQHLVLRILLRINHFAPWNYARFLDYCVDRIFLRRAGGGYIFVHRLLMEHFVAMYLEGE